MKFMLFCFENMSGMKINYNKSEVFGIGMGAEDQLKLVDIFGCNVGTLPIIYLGLPVSDIKLTKAQLSYVAEKTKRRLST